MGPAAGDGRGGRPAGATPGRTFTTTGLRFIRMTSARQSGSIRSSSGGTAGCLAVAVLDGAAQLRRPLKRVRVADRAEQHLGPAGRPDRVGAVLAPAVLQLADRVADGRDQHALACRSTSITGRSTGQTWVTSSRAISSGGSSRLCGPLLPASPAS